MGSSDENGGQLKNEEEERGGWERTGEENKEQDEEKADGGPQWYLPDRSRDRPPATRAVAWDANRFSLVNFEVFRI